MTTVAAHAKSWFEPVGLAELAAEIRQCHDRHAALRPLRINAMAAILEYAPEDLTVTVQTGITLGSLQEALRARGQWLPIDPPHPQTTTLEEIIDRNLSGPRRYGQGTIREWVLGLRAVLADGRIIKAGGKVVKNVAGYDLQKLFVGARRSLGVVVEATFKVMPLPEQEACFQLTAPDLAAVRALLDRVRALETTPVIMDLHNVNSAEPEEARLPGPFHLVTGFAGSAEEVAWQITQLTALDAQTIAACDYEDRFWKSPGSVHQFSVLATRLTETLEKVGAHRFVARAGNGIAYCRGGTPIPPTVRPRPILERLKAEFDPRGVLPPMPC